MTPEQFAYWLQGFAELNPNTPPDATQWKQIQDHLKLVFTKVTPNYPTTINPVGPYNPGTWISPTVPGIRPEVICSVVPTTGSYSTASMTGELKLY